MRFHKPIGIYLLLWPALWGLWAAQRGFPPLKVLIVFVLGSILMRSAGCVINDIADKHIDIHVKRTLDRPLAAGKIKSKEAVLVFLICCFLSFCLVLFLNKTAIFLSFIGMALAIIYPFTKRFIHAPQLFLGFAYAWAIPMGYASLNRPLSWECWYLYGLVILLAIAYDTFYAMVDKEEDIKIGVKSTAIWFGQWDYKIVFLIQISVWFSLLFFGIWQKYSWRYECWIALSLGFFIYQQKLVRKRNTIYYFQAFLNHHWFMLWVWVGFLLI